jgi:HAMP domain-containing protein
LTWALGTGVPVVGLTLVGIGELVGTIDASSERVATTAVTLGGVALIIGLAATVLTARSLADPLNAVRRAVRQVQRGENDTEVDVYDGTSSAARSVRTSRAKRWSVGSRSVARSWRSQCCSSTWSDRPSSPMSGRRPRSWSC